MHYYSLEATNFDQQNVHVEKHSSLSTAFFFYNQIFHNT